MDLTTGGMLWLISGVIGTVLCLAKGATKGKDPITSLIFVVIFVGMGPTTLLVALFTKEKDNGD